MTVGAGTRVVIPEPTFTLYALLTAILGGEAVRVPLGPDLEYDADAHRAARGGSARRPSPSSARRTTRRAASLPPRGGGAPVRGSGRPGRGRRGVPRVRGAVGGAAAGRPREPRRAAHVLQGHGAGRPARRLPAGRARSWSREINKARLPYNLNFFSQVAALAALEEQGALEANVVRLRAAPRRALRATCARSRGVRAYPSRANFILFELDGRDPRGGLRVPLRRGRAGARREHRIRGWPLPARERGHRGGERGAPGRAPAGAGRGLAATAAGAREVR